MIRFCSSAGAARPHRVLFLPAAAALAMGLMLATVPVRVAAQSDECHTDIENLGKRRVGMMQQLNAIAKAGKGKLDPIAACPKLRALAAIETEFSAYLQKNKDWCSIPDNIIESIAASHAKTVKVAAQACGLAAQAKKIQQQQAAGNAPQAPRLPTGPL